VDTPLFSVIIPTYNSAHLLSRALKSVIGQTYRKVEIIVADDGSTDNTLDVMQGYGEQVKYKSISHTGLPAVVRNAALQMAQGEYLAFLDADDVWLPEKLERQLAAMLQNNCNASSTNAWRIRQEEKNGLYLNQSLSGLLTFEDLLMENFIICSSAIVHRSVIQIAGNFPDTPDLRAVEDYALWLRVATLTDWAYLPDPLIYYNDMPAQSIRRNGVSVFAQKRRVFGNFTKWAIRAHITQSFLWQVRKHLVLNSIAETRKILVQLVNGIRK
jgi:glycosyltransferase involved in cell wall biosynthesis